MLVLTITATAVAATLARPVAGAPYGSLAVPAAGGLALAALIASLGPACALSSSGRQMIRRKDAMRGSAETMRRRRDPVFPELHRVACGRHVN